MMLKDRKFINSGENMSETKDILNELAMNRSHVTVDCITKLGEIIKDAELEMSISMQGKRFLVEIKGDHPLTDDYFKEYELGEDLVGALVASYWGLHNFSEISEWVQSPEKYKVVPNKMDNEPHG